MDNEFEHLELPLVFTGRPIYNGFGEFSPQTTINNNNRAAHGNTIRRQSQELSRFWGIQNSQRQQNNLPDISGGVPIMLEIDPNSDVEFLRGLGFEIVSEVDNGFVLVSAEDIDLTVLNQKIDSFINNVARSGTPARVYGLNTNEERIETIMSASLRDKWNNLNDVEEYLVEMSISCNGKVPLPPKPIKKEMEDETRYAQRLSNWNDRFQQKYIEWDNFMSERQEEIQRFVTHYRGNIDGMYHDEMEEFVRFPDSFTIKIKISGKGLRDLVINYPYIFEVVLLEDIIIGNAVSLNNPIDLDGINIISPNANSPIIGIIDSGIERNQLLSPAIFEEYSYVPGDSSTGDGVSNGGHGTRVAGIALTNKEPLIGDYRLPFRLRNIRVLDNNNTLRKELRGAELISNIVKKYNIDATNKTRIFNHSIGERSTCELVHMSSWAAAIDKFSYENDILFVQSAGNIEENDIIGAIDNNIDYPNYLNEEFARICDPAQSLQALTVGSVSHTEYQNGDVVGLGNANEPSSFSRTGPGVWDSIKPEVVEYGGTHALRNSGMAELLKPEELCIKTPRKIVSNKLFSQDVIGTSFSTPKVTSIVAELETIFPTASTLLYRGLIIQSAKWPDWARNYTNKSEVLRRIGYGIPSLERATRNNEYRVTLFSDNTKISSNDAHVYKIPIPDNLRDIGENYDIELEITLSYNANPRRTRRRIKGYLSTWLEWSCSRLNEDYDAFKNRMFSTGRIDNTIDEGDLHWAIGSQRNHGQANDFSKALNTVQKDWARIQSSDLPENFCIAVKAHKGWGENFPANYSLIVTFEAVDRNLEIYSEIRQAVEVEIENNRVQVEVNT